MPSRQNTPTDPQTQAPCSTRRSSSRATEALPWSVPPEALRFPRRHQRIPPEPARVPPAARMPRQRQHPHEPQPRRTGQKNARPSQ